MPLNSKGQKIKAAMVKEYGAKKGAEVFYASENSGRIKEVTMKKPMTRDEMVAHERKQMAKMQRGGSVGLAPSQAPIRPGGPRTRTPEVQAAWEAYNAPKPGQTPLQAAIASGQQPPVRTRMGTGGRIVTRGRGEREQPRPRVPSPVRPGTPPTSEPVSGGGSRSSQYGTIQPVRRRMGTGGSVKKPVARMGTGGKVSWTTTNKYYWPGDKKYHSTPNATDESRAEDAAMAAFNAAPREGGRAAITAGQVSLRAQAAARAAETKAAQTASVRRIAAEQLEPGQSRAYKATPSEVKARQASTARSMAAKAKKRAAQ